MNLTGMKIRKVFFQISVMLLVSSLFLIIANNVPVFMSYRWLWGPGFLVFSIFFYPKTISHQSVSSALIYGLLFAGILQYSLWIHAIDWYKKAVFEDFYALIVVVLLFAILFRQKYYLEWQKLAKIGLLFFIITGIMTLIATSINPLVVRASYSSGRYQMAEYDELFKLGFGSYGYMIAIVALIPVLVYFYKNNRKFWLSKKVIIILIFFFYVVLIRAQIIANIIIASIILIVAILGAEKFKKKIIIYGLLGVIFLAIPTRFWVEGFQNLSALFEPGSLLNYRFQDLAFYIENPEIAENSSRTAAAGRAARYPMLLNAFMENPFLGDASYGSNFSYELIQGTHLYWMSRLALWGLWGFIGYIFILRSIFKPVINMFDSNFKFYYQLSLLSVVALGLIKNLGGREPYIMLLIIIPGLYLSQYRAISKTKTKSVS